MKLHSAIIESVPYAKLKLSFLIAGILTLALGMMSGPLSWYPKPLFAVNMLLSFWASTIGFVVMFGFILKEAFTGKFRQALITFAMLAVNVIFVAVFFTYTSIGKFFIAN